jgi:hypothetical protein
VDRGKIDAFLLGHEELLALAFPGCKLRPGTGPHDTLIGIEAARELIGYEPEWTWRKIVKG